MIGGKVLDASALSHFATVKSIYAQAVAWAAVEDNTVLVVPATALTVAWADIPSLIPPWRLKSCRDRWGRSEAHRSGPCTPALGGGINWPPQLRA